MKAYLLIKKDQPSYSHEKHVVMAENKRELNTILKEEKLDKSDFDVEEINKTGLIYSDIY